MAEIAISGALAALRKVASWLGDQAVEAGSRLFKLKQDILWIENEMEYIRAFLEYFDYENNGEAIDTVANAIVKNVRLLAYDVEDILESYLLKIASKKQKGCLGWVANAKLTLWNSSFVLKVSLEIEEIKKRVKDINRVKQTYGITPRKKEFIGLGMDERRSFPHTEEGNIVGMDDKVKELNAKLLNNDLSHLVVSITGMAGLGKTTLAKKVYNSVVKNFNCSAWICVSQQPNIPELLRDVSRQVGLDEEKLKQNKELNLFEFLRDRRYVFVIDDLWQIKAWDGLKNGIPTNSKNGSRIIITSRYKDVGEYAGGKGSVYELKPLNETESRNLFFKIINRNLNPGNMIEKSENLPPSLLNIGEKILDKCDGIPLAIVLTSGMLSLREKADYAWKGVLESMSREEDRCSQIFELSYKDLPSKLRPCFLYFGLFPEDYIIHASSLINLWAGERFIEGSEVREVEEVGEDYLNQLVVRNLVQVSSRKFNGRIKTCQVHDILHSLCVRVAKEINFFRINKDVGSNSTMVTRVRRYANHDAGLSDFISLGHETPKLRALLWFNSKRETCSKKDSKDLIWDLKYLRVMCIQRGLYLDSFSRKVGNLVHLTYIRVAMAYGKEIPSSIENLKSLMTLDARDCHRVILPGCIWEMKCLRHLLLHIHGKIKLPANKTAGNIKVINLRTLSLLRLPAWPTFPNKYQLPSLRKLGLRFYNGNVTNIKMLLENAPKIEVLDLLNRGTDPEPLDIRDLNLHRFKNLCRIHINGVLRELTDHHVFPQHITKLTFEHTLLKEDPMKVLKKLPMLKFLTFKMILYLGIKMIVSSEGDECSSYDSFPQLEVLELNLGFRLKELLIEEPAMPQLKILRLEYPYTKVNAPERIKDKVTGPGPKMMQGDMDDFMMN